MLAARSSIVTVGDERAICVERYDRVRTADGQVLRVHQEDLCQALGVHPDAKYESEGGPSVAAVGGLLSRHVPGSVGQPSGCASPRRWRRTGC